MSVPPAPSTPPTAPTGPMPFADALGDRYVVERELGRGGMATVYVARDVRHGRLVALKVVDRAVAAGLTAERFLAEIRITAGLSHPNIIPLLDSGVAGESLYYVTPFAPGESLRARLDREGALPVRDAVRIAREVADALAHAHEHGVVHRDVKPENVLLVAGHAVVADFGIARALDAAAGDGLTATGMAIGTPAYMSPEQAAGDHTLDGRADVYSLGCVLYELLAGEPPFRAPTTQALIARHAVSPTPSVRETRPSVSEALDRVVARAMAKVPGDRFATAAALRDALDAVLESGDTGTVPNVVVSRPRNAASRRLALVAVAVIVLVALAVVAARLRAPSPSGESATRLAVLPMANLSPDPNDRYFADGMTDELISTLANLGGLRVIARSSVLGYAGTTKPARQIGRELHVGAVLESTCRKAGDRLRITVRLVDAATDEERWAQQYDRQLADVFAIQRDVALRVARELRVRLLADESRRVAHRPTRNLDAYEQYLRGTILLGERIGSPAAGTIIDSSITLLHRAVALDTGFALAHAKLAQAQIDKLFNQAPGTALRDSAAAEVAKALALDSSLAEAYVARADLAYTREAGWRLEDALRDYLRAVALKPNFDEAHQALGTLLFHVGILDAARRELETALALDPTSRFVPLRIPRVLWYGQRYDSALALMERGEGFVDEHALVLGYLGRARDGLAMLDSATEGAHGQSDYSAARAVLLARLGRNAEAEAAIQRATARGQATSHFHHAEFDFAMAYAIMGRRDEAVRWLQRTADDGMPAYELFAGDPTLAPLRTDPRFVRFMDAERARNARLRAILAAPI